MHTRSDRLAAALMPAVDDLRLDRIEIRRTAISVAVTSTQPTACCPRCGTAARRVRSRYHRTLADLPWGGYAVSLHLTVRKFACDVVDCPQRIFTERLPQLVSSYARRTNRCTELLRVIAFALGGEPGERVLQRLSMPTSAATLLRVIRQTSLPRYESPRVLGIDDWARRRGQSYGTIMVDLERRRPIDLLPDRTAATVRDWLAAHPDVEIISRDRGGVYAEAAATGAPTAVQVADRWHVLHNLADVLERAFSAHRTRIRQVLQPNGPQSPLAAAAAVVAHVPPPVPSPQTQADIAMRRTARRARYELVQTLRTRGMTQRAIAEQVHLNPKTVQRWLAAGSFPELPARRVRSSVLDPYKPYLLECWAQGCHTGERLFEEIAGHGYQGGRTTLRDFLVCLRPQRGRQAQRGGDVQVAAAEPPTVRQFVWYVLRRDDAKTDDEQAAVARLRAAHADVAEAVELAHAFVAIVRRRQPKQLDPWLWRVANSHVAALRSFAAGIQLPHSCKIGQPAASYCAAELAVPNRARWPPCIEAV